MNKAKTFIQEAERVAFDKKHRATIRFNMSKYDAAVKRGQKRYENLETAKEKCSQIKQHVVDNLAHYLQELEQNCQNNGIEVLWASDGADAIDFVKHIIVENKAKLLVKSKSMVTEEIDFNHKVAPTGIESIETDLGEYIVQLEDMPPYHIVTPAMHKSKEDIAELFNKMFKTPVDSSPEYLTGYVREKLRKLFTSAEIGVTGANFLIADVGGISLTENEGNAVMSAAFPKIHIAIAGIEKLIPSLKDLALFLPTLAVHGTGQRISCYNSVFTGQKLDSEQSGPEKMYLILLDNGRTDIYANEKQRDTLKCIRCGACLNACPVYRNIGGYTYDTTYTGPIGKAISPVLREFKTYKHLSFACSLCGKCDEVCPVKIPLHKHILENRKHAVESGYTAKAERIAMKALQDAMLNRKLFDFGSANIRNLAVSVAGKKAWGKRRDLPELKKSFAKQWKNFK